jgi:hypothetical protein
MFLGGSARRLALSGVRQCYARTWATRLTGVPCHGGLSKLKSTQLPIRWITPATYFMSLDTCRPLSIKTDTTLDLTWKNPLWYQTRLFGSKSSSDISSLLETQQDQQRTYSRVATTKKETSVPTFTHKGDIKLRCRYE